MTRHPEHYAIAALFAASWINAARLLWPSILGAFAGFIVAHPLMQVWAYSMVNF